jgi:hypothetical protein
MNLRDTDMFKYWNILELAFLRQDKAAQLFKTSIVVLLSKLQIRRRCRKMRQDEIFHTFTTFTTGRIVGLSALPDVRSWLRSRKVVSPLKARFFHEVIIYIMTCLRMTVKYIPKAKELRLTWAVKKDFGLEILGCFARSLETADHAFAPCSQTACARRRASRLLRIGTISDEVACDLRDDLVLIAVATKNRFQKAHDLCFHVISERTDNAS